MLMTMTTRAPVDPVDGPAPLRALDVPPAPVRDPRGGARAGIVALVAVAGAIVLAVGIAQLAPPDAPVRPAPPSAEASAAAVTPTPTPSLGPDASAADAGIPPRLSRDDLVAAVRDGTLEGRLVFVDGALRVTAIRCRDQAGCVDLEIAGIGLPVTAGDVAIPWSDNPPEGVWLVTVARSGGLVYLGSLVPVENGAVPIEDLTGRLLGSRLDDPPTSLFEVTGYLVARSVWPCIFGDAAPTICPPLSRFLADDAPNPDGSLSTPRGANVMVAASVPGVDRHDAVTHGTFLVTLPGDAPCRPRHVDATCTPAAVTWEVVARYEPSQAVRVLVP
jgi:hypothetical protein